MRLSKSLMSNNIHYWTSDDLVAVKGSRARHGICKL